MIKQLLSWFKGGDRQDAAGRSAQAQPDLAEYGTTGTPIFGGFLRDAGEYNPALEGLSAFTTYEKMRRSDAQVDAASATRSLSEHRIASIESKRSNDRYSHFVGRGARGGPTTRRN